MISTAGRYAACNGNSYSALPEGRSFISAGTQTRTGGELKIKDLGMQGSKLVIVAAEITAEELLFGIENQSSAARRTLAVFCRIIFHGMLIYSVTY